MQVHRRATLLLPGTGDALVERRVTTDVFFGKRLAELTEAAPELIGAAHGQIRGRASLIRGTFRRASVWADR